MKFIAFISLATLLCAGLSNERIISLTHDTAVSHAEKYPHENYSTVTTADIFCNIAQNESSVSISGGSAHSGIRDFFSDFSSGIHIDRLATNQFVRYTFYARHIISRLRNTDIIFPFHYFW